MSSEGGGKLRPKRSHAAPPKPYERKKSLFGKVAETVKDIFSPSWLSDLVANINRTPEKEEEEAENEDQTQDPHETGLVSADNARPSTASRAYDYELLRIRSNGQPRSQDFLSQAVSSPLPPLGVSPFTPYTEFTSAQLPLTRLPEKSDSMIVNDDNQSQRSDISKSTSGCSSMIPHPDKRDYQSEVLHEDSMSDVSVFASVSVSTSQRPLQLQHPSDKYRKVPEIKKTYAWTPCSSGIQHSKPQAPANRNNPSFNASLFGSPIQVDASLLEQSFESSFYAGKTTYGGAAAHRKARLNNASPYQSYPVKKQIRPKPTNNTFDAVTSSTARRIMGALEKMSTPVNDAKKFPVNEFLQGSFLAQKPYNNRSYSGQSSSRATPGPSGFNSSFTSRRSEVKKGPPLNMIMTPEFAVISKNRQVATPPDIMAKLDARIREENKARTVEANSWSLSCQDTVAVRDLSMGASYGKMKRDKSYHKSSKKLEQNDTEIIPDLKTDFTLPLKELPKFQFTPTISGSRNLDSTLQKETLSPKFTFSSPMKEVQPVEKSDSASSVKKSDSASSVRSEFKFSSPIKVDGKKKSDPSFNFVTITSSSSTSFSTSGCSFGAAASKPFVFSSTEPGFMLTSPLSDTAPRVKERPKSNAATDLKQGNIVVEALKGSTSPFQPAAQLKMGSVMDILGKTDSSSPQPPSNYLFGKFQPTAGSWKCGICLIQNKAEDAECPACQTPKPMTPSRPTATIEPGFVTTATPLVNITLMGSWKCDTCLIKDKAEVKKCVACGSAKPAKPTESSLGSTSIPAGSWKCDTCLIPNKAEVNKCAACGSAKPVKSTGSESSSTSPVSYLNAFPPGNWICASCLIQNKADAVKCGKCQSNKPAGKSDGVAKTDNSLSDKFRPAVGSWTCNICLVLNKGTSTKCVSCETEKPPPKTGDNLMNNFKKPLGTWDCEICLVTNKPTAVQCIACDSPRPGEKPKHLVPSVAGFKIAAGAFSQNSGFSLPCVSRNESSAPALFKFGSTSGKSDTTTTVPSGFKFGDSSLSGTSSEIKTTQSTFKLGDSSTGTKASSASVVDSQVKKVDSGNSDFKFGGQTTTVTAKTKSASATVGGTTDNVFGQQQNIRSNNDSHKENSTTEELSFKSSNSNASGNSTIKTGGFEFRFSPSSNSQSNSTSFPSSASTGGFSLNKPTNDSIDSSGQTLSKSERTNGGITTASPFSAQSNVTNSVTVNNLGSQQSSIPSSKAESLPTGGFTFTNPILVEDSNKLAVGSFNFISKSSEESKVANNKPFVFGATANNDASDTVASNKSIFKLQPSSETSKLKRTNSDEESDARPGGKRQAMGFGEGSAVNTAPGVFTTTTPFQFTPTAVNSADVNASKTSGSTGMFTFGQQNTGTSAQPFLSAGSTTISPFNPTGFSSISPAAAAATPTAAPVFNFTGQNNTQNFTGQNNTQNSSVFSFTAQSSTTKSSPFPDFGSVKSTASNTQAFGGTSQFSFTGQKQDTSSNMVTTPYGSTTVPGFGGFGSSGITGTTNPASSPFGGASSSGNVFMGTGSSNTQFGGNGFGSTATSPGFGGSSGTSFGGSAPVFGGNTTSPATTPAGFSFNFGSTTQNNPFQFTAKPADNNPQQQLVAPPSSVFVFGQTPANPTPQQQSVAAPNSVFVFGQTPADNKPQQQLVAPPSSVFVFGQTQPNPVPPAPAPLSPGAFNFTSQPVYNFTGSSVPPGFAFSVTSSQGENPSSNRKIKKAVRKIRR